MRALVEGAIFLLNRTLKEIVAIVLPGRLPYFDCVIRERLSGGCNV